MGHFADTQFPPKLSFQVPSWFFSRRISLNLTSYFSWRKVFSCFSYAPHKRQLFTPPQWWIYTRISIQGPQHCDDREQGSYTELLLMRACYSWFCISSYLPQLFCQCLSSPTLIFHLNCRRLQFLGQGVWLSSDLCDCHWLNLDWQELKRFSAGRYMSTHKLWDYKNEYKNLSDKKKQHGTADICLVRGLLWDINTQMHAHEYRQISAG